MDLLARLFGPPLPVISPLELHDKLKADPRPYLLDVREAEEYQQAHIAGAKLIPLGTLSRRLNEVPKDREIVCLCQTGSRSTAAAQQLHAAGYTVLNLKGGMIGWQWSHKLPVKKGNAP